MYYLIFRLYDKGRAIILLCWYVREKARFVSQVLRHSFERMYINKKKSGFSKCMPSTSIIQKCRKQHQEFYFTIASDKAINSCITIRRFLSAFWCERSLSKKKHVSSFINTNEIFELYLYRMYLFYNFILYYILLRVHFY